MDENKRESIERRWERLKHHLDEAKKEEETRRFRFSLLTFLFATTATGAIIGWAVSVRGTDEGTLLILIAALVAYVIVLGTGLILYLREIDEHDSQGRGRTADGTDPPLDAAEKGGQARLRQEPGKRGTGPLTIRCKANTVRAFLVVKLPRCRKGGPLSL